MVALSFEDASRGQGFFYRVETSFQKPFVLSVVKKFFVNFFATLCKVVIIVLHVFISTALPYMDFLAAHFFSKVNFQIQQIICDG